MLDAVQYLGPLDRGWTKPQLFRCSDGNKYIVKFMNNPLGRKVLPSELIAYRLGKRLGLPVAPCKAVYISKGLIGLYPDLKALELQSGPHLGVYFYENALETDNAEVIAQCVNLNQAAGMIVFDHWIRNWDRHNRSTNNLLFVGNEIVLIDHANCFDGPHWNEASLRKRQKTTSVYWGKMYQRFVPYIDGPHPFSSSIAAISSIKESEIKKALENIPKEWKISREEARALTDYLNYRKSILHSVIGKLKKHFPVWHSTP